MAHDQKHFAFATRLWAEALARDPKLIDDPHTRPRYHAACSAVRAADGQGQDEPPLDDAAKAKLRGQALDWLNAELTACGKDPSRRAILPTLSQWNQDGDLAAIRDQEALAKLPADEQKAFTRLWADVRSTVLAFEQVEEIRKELTTRNPRFNGTLTPTIENGAVIGLDFGTNPMVSDLTPLKGMSLKTLKIQGTSVADLSPLNGMPLEDIRLTPKTITRGLEILRDMKSLKTIGIADDKSWPAAEFWARYDKGEFK